MNPGKIPQIPDLTSAFTPEQNEIWKSALELANTCAFEQVHSYQVTRLAVHLFDELQALHQLSSQERFWLHLAGLLHDIGWCEGWKSHHKTSLNIILTTPMLPFDQRERLLIGSVCRYHRKALPDLSHDHFSALSVNDRRIVGSLAALLRVADGLDCTHRSLIHDLTARINPSTIELDCQAVEPAHDESHDAIKKGNLLEATYNRILVIDWILS
jgi:exopolyphosphatase/pppGpp-phosphohydrolase